MEVSRQAVHVPTRGKGGTGGAGGKGGRGGSALALHWWLLAQRTEHCQRIICSKAPDANTPVAQFD